MRCFAVATGLAAVLLVGCGGSPVSAPPPDPAPSEPPSLSTLLGRRAAHTATGLPDGSALIAGGCDVDGCSVATRSAVLLGPDGARPTGDLAQPRAGHVAGRLPDGRVLVAGGYGGEGQPPLATAEVFDPRRGRWRPVGSMAAGRGGHDAAVLGDGRVIVVGGWRGPGRHLARTEIFDPASGQFTRGPALSVPADALAAATLADGSVLVAGGQTRPGVASAAATVIAADGRSVHQVAPMGQARFKHALVALPDGRALVVGGTSDDETLLASTEVFDPRRGAFHPGPALVHGRYKLAGGTAVLPDSRVAVGGGGPGLEVMDPGPGASSMVAGAAEVVASFSTLSVVGSDLWLVGGYDQRIRLTELALRLPLAAL